MRSLLFLSVCAVLIVSATCASCNPGALGWYELKTRLPVVRDHLLDFCKRARAPSWSNECDNLVWISLHIEDHIRTREDVVQTWYEFCYDEPLCLDPWEASREAVDKIAPAVLTSGIFTKERTYRVTADLIAPKRQWRQLKATIASYCRTRKCEQWVFCDRQTTEEGLLSIVQARQRALLAIWHHIAREHEWAFDPSYNRNDMGLPYVPYLFNHTDYAKAVGPLTWTETIWVFFSWA